METNLIKEDIISPEIKLQYFPENIDPEELKWSNNNVDTLIRVMGVTDWMLQFDELPPIKMDEDIIVPKGKAYRFIKGESVLNVIHQVIDIEG